jgi:hypothetical protein
MPTERDVHRHSTAPLRVESPWSSHPARNTVRLMKDTMQNFMGRFTRWCDSRLPTVIALIKHQPARP